MIIFPPVVVAGGKPSISYVANGGENTAASSHTFTGVNLGTAHPTRKMLLFMSSYGEAGTYTATFDGVAATELTGCRADPFTTGHGTAFIINKPTGATATIVIGLSVTRPAFFGLYALYNVRSSTPTDTDVGTTTTDANLSVNVAARGVAASYAMVGEASSWEWTGMTENFDAVLPAESLTHSGASYTAVAAQSPLNLSSTPAFAFGINIRMAAAFR